MTSRKAAFKDDETSNKRKRIAREADDHTRTSFESLNNDCVLQILSFLPVEDLNTFALISHRYCVLRRHESLDQTRIASIICSQSNESSSRRSLLKVFSAARSTLSSHYTHLIISELEIFGGDISNNRIPIERLPNTTKLELVASNPNERSGEEPNDNHLVQNLLPEHAPNIKELVLNQIPNSWILRVGRGLPQLARVSHFGGCTVDMNGWNYSESPALTDLNLDGCCLMSWSRFSVRELEFARFTSWVFSTCFLMRHVLQLRRLSMKGATWSVFNKYGESAFEPEPVPQDMLIKMVRNHSTFRWLRSDLSQENIAMLKQERPDITFVSD